MNDLLPILRRIRDGQANASDVGRARALVAEDARLDEELRAIALTDPDDLPGDAAGLLAVLGDDDLGSLIAKAVAQEAGALPDLDVVDETTLDTQGWTFGSDLVDAVRFEAGAIEVVSQVLSACGLQDELPVAAAVRTEAGPVDIAEAVVSWSAVDVRGAVRDEAGEVDVVNAVMARIIQPPVVATPPPDLPQPANDTRGYGIVAVVLAAAVALFVSIAGIETGPEPLPALAFAHADEVVVEDLSSDTDVLMLQGGGQDGALILWVDEET